MEAQSDMLIVITNFLYQIFVASLRYGRHINSDTIAHALRSEGKLARTIGEWDVYAWSSRYFVNEPIRLICHYVHILMQRCFSFR